MIFKIKPKMQKYFSNKKKIATINISQSNITNKLITNILELFKFEYVIIIMDLEKDNSLFKEFDKLNIKYTTSFQRKNNPYVEVILKVESTDLKNVLSKIINVNSENIFLYNVNNSISWEQYLYNNKYFQINKLNSDISDLYFQFSFSESIVYISYSTEKYNPEVINNQIKQIISEN